MNQQVCTVVDFNEGYVWSVLLQMQHNTFHTHTNTLLFSLYFLPLVDASCFPKGSRIQRNTCSRI